MSHPSIVAQNAVRPVARAGDKSAWRGWIWIITGGLLLLLGASAVVARVVPTPSADAAAVLAAITATAVGIERVIEIFWTAIGLTVGSFWPFKGVHSRIESFVKTLNIELEPLYTKAAEEIDKVGAAHQWGAERINGAKQEITRLQETLGAFQNAAPNKERAMFMVSFASEEIDKIKAKYPDVDATTQRARQSIDIAKNILETFKDNPARRLISLYIGAILGLIVAGLTGLDVIQATLGASTGLFPGIGVALTGLLMGLGSNPTHEVIRVLQEVKESRKAGNDQH